MRKITLVLFLALSFNGQAQFGGLIKKAADKAGSAISNSGKDDKRSGSGTAETENSGTGTVETKSSVSSGAVTKGGSNGKLELFTEEAFNYPQYKNHIGEVLFSRQDFEREIPESAYIKSFKIGDKVAARSFSAHSAANSVMLQMEENGISASEINKMRNGIGESTSVFVIMYFDGKQFMFTGGVPGYSFEDATKLPTVRFDLNEGTDKEFFGEYLLQDLVKRTDLMTGGTHKLKFEVMPQLVEIQNAYNIKFKPLAVGEIDMIVPETVPTAANCFPYKAVSDAALEAEVLKVMKGKNPAAFKVIINNQIKIERDDYGNILNKNFIAAIICKTQEKVWYDVYRFDKLYDGAGYGPAEISRSTDNFTYPRDWKINKECLKFLN